MVINRIKRIFLAVFSDSCESCHLMHRRNRRLLIIMTSDDYIIGGVSVSGVRFLDTNALIGISGLRIGQEITVSG